MSAVLQLPAYWGAGIAKAAPNETRKDRQKEPEVKSKAIPSAIAHAGSPEVSLEFYRKHTESTLRRYLYASMQVGRSPSILGDSVGRGWCSSRPIRTFEDAVIFVLDVEKCLSQLGSLDRQLLSRIVLQEYTQAEAATLLGMSVRAVSYKLPEAVDRLTVKLLESGLLVLPH
ncbi:MAG: sigma factor-like helix-turn-helix DNA-binding protein [Terracidiphilus sp.]|jgi:hypothetical protein